MTTSRSPDWRTEEKKRSMAGRSTPNLAQLWTLKKLRDALGTDQTAWNNILRPYRIKSAHDLSLESADQLIGLLSAAKRARQLQDETTSRAVQQSTDHFLADDDSRMQ